MKGIDEQSTFKPKIQRIDFEHPKTRDLRKAEREDARASQVESNLDSSPPFSASFQLTWMGLAAGGGFPVVPYKK